MNELKVRLDYLLKHNNIINIIFKFVLSNIIKIVGFFIPINDKSIIFSAHGRKYNDSPRAIYEYMISSPDYSEYKYYWALDDPEKTEVPGNCVKIKSDTIKYFKTALKCKYWITCVNIERGLRFKRKKTVYLNTWHGIPIKTVGNKTVGRKDYDFSYIDYFCVSSVYEIEVYNKSFLVPEGHILKTGMPRNDALYHTSDEEINQIKEKLSLPHSKKIILYAPTWRDSRDAGRSYKIRPPIDVKYWEKKLKNSYILLFRTHPYTNELLGIEFNDFVRDYTDYPNINDLMKVADILVSDYSATIFDYSILERPIISFAYDCEEYAKERGFSIDIRNEMPGGICETEDEVIGRILSMDYVKEIKEVKRFKERYLKYSGNATYQCVKIVFNK